MTYIPVCASKVIPQCCIIKMWALGQSRPTTIAAFTWIWKMHDFCIKCAPDFLYK